MVRCFIGILAPESIKTGFKRLENEIAKLPVVCKFVEVENLHLCFSFLGEVEDDKIDGIKEKLDMIAGKYSSFSVRIKGMKAIPNERFIRVLVLDVIDEGKKLEPISKDIVKEIGGDSKPPHLTVCRVKNITDRQVLLSKIEDMKNIEIGEILIDGIQLIKSELNRSGPMYSVIHEALLS